MYWNNHKLRTEHSQTPNQLWITGVEIDPNIRFLGEISNNVIIPRTPFKLTNDEWVTINSMDLTSNDGNFDINVYLNLCTHLEGLYSVREYFQG